MLRKVLFAETLEEIHNAISFNQYLAFISASRNSLSNNVSALVEKKGYDPMILLDMLVLAAFMMHSFPNSSTLMVKCSWMYLQASLKITVMYYLKTYCSSHVCLIMKCTSSAIVSGKFTAFAKRFNKWTWKRILIFLFPMRITVKCYKAAQQINGRWSGIGLIISVI